MCTPSATFRHFTALVVIASLMGAAPRSRADQPTTSTPSRDPKAGRELFERASQAFARGDYATAAESFRAAYERNPLPALLLNAAQAYRLMSPPDCEAATLHYKRYLEAEPAAPERREIEGHLIVMQACTSSRRRLAAAPVLTAAQPSPQPVERSSAGPKWLLGAGVLTAVVGTGLYFRARARYNELASQCPCSEDEIDRWGTITRISYGLWTAGGLALVGGSVWWFRTRDVALTHIGGWVAPGGGGLTVAGRL